MEPEHLLQPVGLGHQRLDLVLHVFIAIAIAIAIAIVAATKPLPGAPARMPTGVAARGLPLATLSAAASATADRACAAGWHSAAIVGRLPRSIHRRVRLRQRALVSPRMLALALALA